MCRFEEESRFIKDKKKDQTDHALGILETGLFCKKKKKKAICTCNQMKTELESSL